MQVIAHYGWLRLLLGALLHELWLSDNDLTAKLLRLNSGLLAVCTLMKPFRGEHVRGWCKKSCGRGNGAVAFCKCGGRKLDGRRPVAVSKLSEHDGTCRYSGRCLQNCTLFLPGVRNCY